MIDQYIAARQEVAALRRHLATVIRERDAARAEVERHRAHTAQRDIRTLEESRGAYPRFTRAGW